jgi:hypothetical protein
MECHMRVIESENDEVILKQSLSIDKSQICIWLWIDMNSN